MQGEEGKMMSGGDFHIEIETTNLCNTRCLHCPHDAVSRHSGKMSWVTYQTVMDKLMALTPNISVEYGGMGEPMLNPLIYQFIKYVSGNMTTSLTTNASALTLKNVKRLIEAGLSNLTISFNGSDKALYELMMGGLSFERAQHNLRTAVEACKGTGLHLSANVSITRQTEKSLTKIKAYLEEVGIKAISFSMAHNRAGFMKDQSICNTPMPPVDKHRCDIFAITLFVAWTGEVLSCCHDLKGTNVIGSLMSESVKDILQIKDKIIKEGVKFEICRQCNDMARFWNDQTPGDSISNWVYNLYKDGQAQEQTRTSLLEWIYALYQNEGQLRKLFLRLNSRAIDQAQEISSLNAWKQEHIQLMKAKSKENELSGAELGHRKHRSAGLLLIYTRKLLRFFNILSRYY